MGPAQLLSSQLSSGAQAGPLFFLGHCDLAVHPTVEGILGSASHGGVGAINQGHAVVAYCTLRLLEEERLPPLARSPQNYLRKSGATTPFAEEKCVFILRI